MDPKVINSGIKENVIPSRPSATIHFSILPGLTIEQLISHVTAAIDDDRIKISLTDFHSEASEVSSTSSASFAVLNKSIKEVFPTLLTAPNLSIGTTDGRYYEEISENVYRFLPIHLNPYNLKAIYGIDENIPVNEFENVIRFYIQLLKNCNK
jgi:carboxypeptidase PM20D1